MWFNTFLNSNTFRYAVVRVTTVNLSYTPDCLVKWRAEELTVVPREAHACYTFTVGPLELTQTLTCENLPDLKYKISYTYHKCLPLIDPQWSHEESAKRHVDHKNNVENCALFMISLFYNIRHNNNSNICQTTILKLSSHITCLEQDTTIVNLCLGQKYTLLTSEPLSKMWFSLLTSNIYQGGSRGQFHTLLVDTTLY